MKDSKGERGFGLSVFCLFLVLFCNVMCVGGEGFSFLHQPTMGYERQIETDER